VSTIAVIGAGYVGLSSAVGLAHLGHDVIAFDVDQSRVDSLNEGIPPFYEERLEELLREGIGRGRLRFQLMEKADLADREFVLLCLPTPQGSNGAADVSAIKSAVEKFSSTLAKGAVVINKSTATVGTTRWVVDRLRDHPVSVVSNPEFLQEGRALTEFLKGERLLIGADDPIAADRVKNLYAGTGVPVISTSIESAELAKYACNTFLATKLSFVNSIAELCEKMGADITEVAAVMGSDSRIGKKFLSAGPAWGGPCLPKDSRALLHMAENANIKFTVLEAAVKANEESIEHVVAKVLRLFNNELKGISIGVWGLTFKAGTDDIRDSPAVDIVNRLISEGANVSVFDPMHKTSLKGAVAATNAYDACIDAHALVILTEWPEFAATDLTQVATLMTGRVIVDTRNIVSADAALSAGFRYLATGRQTRDATPDLGNAWVE